MSEFILLPVATVHSYFDEDWLRRTQDLPNRYRHPRSFSSVFLSVRPIFASAAQAFAGEPLGSPLMAVAA
jgi:hypothetical protein